MIRVKAFAPMNNIAQPFKNLIFQYMSIIARYKRIHLVNKLFQQDSSVISRGYCFFSVVDPYFTKVGPNPNLYPTLKILVLFLIHSSEHNLKKLSNDLFFNFNFPSFSMAVPDFFKNQFGPEGKKNADPDPRH